MKTYLLTAIIVVMLGCNNSTTPEPVIVDAVTYPHIEYLPFDTTIKYVFNSNSKEVVFQTKIQEGISDYLIENKTIRYIKDYSFGYGNSVYRYDMFNFTQEQIHFGIKNYVSFHGNKDGKRVVQIVKNDYETEYKPVTIPGELVNIKKLYEYIINNIRYKDVLEVKTQQQADTGTILYSNYYFAKGIGLIKSEYKFDNDRDYITTELIRTYK